MLKELININPIFKYIKENYVIQLRYFNDKNDFNFKKNEQQIGYINLRNRKRIALLKIQIKENEKKELIIIFFTHYNNKYTEVFDSVYHIPLINKALTHFDESNKYNKYKQTKKYKESKEYKMLTNFIEYSEPIKVLELKKFKKKNFRTDILYADHIKEILCKKLSKQYPNAIIISEFTIGRTIVDIFMIYNNKIYLYEIKSVVDSFDRLERQLKDYLLIGDYVSVVLDETHIEKFKDVKKSDKIGIMSINSNGKIKLLKKSLLNKVIINLYDYLWSSEIMSIIKGKLHSKLDSTKKKLLLYIQLKDKKNINSFVKYVLTQRYEKDSLKYKEERYIGNCPKTFIKNPNYIRRYSNYIKNKYYPEDFLMDMKNIDLIFKEHKVLYDLLKELDIPINLTYKQSDFCYSKLKKKLNEINEKEFSFFIHSEEEYYYFLILLKKVKSKKEFLNYF